MAQYTSTFTAADGTVTNSVLNSVTNTQTITVTAPSGQVATATVNPSDISSNTDNIITNLERQLNEQGAGGTTGVGLRGITQGLNNTTAAVSRQSEEAKAVSVATGNPPPAESQAIPVPAADNPNPTPNPDVVVTPVRDAPPATTDPDVNNGAIGLGVDTTVIQQSVAEDIAANQADALAAADGLITPSVQQNITNDDAAAQVATLAARDGLITPQVQETIVNEASAAQVDNLAARDGLITPSVQQSIAADTAYAQTEALAAADGLITPNVASSIATGSSVGLQGNTIRTQAQATLQDVTNFQQAGDWRVRLKLAPSAKYLYKADDPGILLPLKQSDGVIFPYTPQVSVAYAAHYDPTELTHSNYKIFQYKNSSVDQISITCDFTAQDTFEANYLLAVIHFFRSVTKMFYGQDQNPNNGTPPPLCYLTGLGAFQFDNHPIAITGFTYSLPNDVDYIRAGSATNNAGVNLSSYESKSDPKSAAAARLFNSNLQPGAVTAPPVFAFANGNAGTRQPTYVPTKMSISIQASPIVTRNDISNIFSLKKYATGELLQGSRKPSPGGGIW